MPNRSSWCALLARFTRDSAIAFVADWVASTPTDA